MKRIILLGLLAVIVLLFFQFDLEQYLTLDYVKSQRYLVHRLTTLPLPKRTFRTIRSA